MSTYAFMTSSGVEIKEPQPGQYTRRRSRHKQVARIICHLRDELGGAYPQLNMPTRAIIERLVVSACNDRVLHSGEWQAIVVETLKNIRHQARNSLNTRQDSPAPYAESFDEWDAFRFCQVLLQHLENL